MSRALSRTWGRIKRPILLSLMLATSAPMAQAEPLWLTIIGDAQDATQTTIQIAPTPVSVKEDTRVMTVRVSRPVQRTSTDGVKFQSFTSQVQFDCTQKSARFVQAEFYAQPLWRGTAHQTLQYGPAKVRPMVFRGVEPNPAARIIRAACGLSG